MGAAIPAEAELMYDNTRGNGSDFMVRKFEYGDEITLHGTARTMTRFEIEYFGDFTPDADETLTIRFYQNDGVARFPFPKTLLYQSGPIPISPGRNTVTINGLAIDVPEDFTVTVEFQGLAGVEGDQAGIVLNSQLPDVGFTYRDWWQSDGKGNWQLLEFTNDIKANFAVRVFGAPDPPVRLEGIEPFGNGWKIILTGPIGATYEVQTSEDLIHWTRFRDFTLDGSPSDFRDRRLGVNKLFYRLAPPPVRIKSIQRLDDGVLSIKMQAPIDAVYQLQTSPDLLSWQNLSTVEFMISDERYVDLIPPGRRASFYRLIPIGK